MGALSPYLYRPSVAVRRKVVGMRRKAVKRSALAGSSFWSSVAIAELLLRFARHQMKKEPEHLTTDRVLIGQVLSITAIERTSRRDKRDARKAAKAAGTAL